MRMKREESWRKSKEVGRCGDTRSYRANMDGLQAGFGGEE